MSPLCDVCHASPAVVGPFCSRCSQALLDTEAKRLLTLQKEGREEAEELKQLPPETFTWEKRHEEYRRELGRRVRTFSLMGGGCE